MNQKYYNDPEFKTLVDVMENFIHQNKYTPSEMREAALMASINYEMRRTDRIVYLDPKTEEALQILRNVVCE
jgi:hypothetical protein